MKLRFVHFFIVIVHSGMFGQLYVAHSKWGDAFVEIGKDSAKVETFNSYHRSFKSNEELLPAYKLGDTIFRGDTYSVLRQNGLYFLSKRKPKKTTKDELQICRNDYRKNEDHLHYRERKLNETLDSIAGPLSPFGFAHSILSQVNAGNYSYKEYTRVIDRGADSIIKSLHENPLVSAWYSTLDSLETIDSSKVYRLLSSADFKRFYGKKLVYSLATKNPGYLIKYVDKKPRNKDTLLKAIKYHRNSNEIVRCVKKSPVRTQGRKEIVRQKASRIAENVAAGTLYITIILAELALIVWLISLL